MKNGLDRLLSPRYGIQHRTLGLTRIAKPNGRPTGGNVMKRLILAGVAASALFALATGAQAADKKTLVFVVNGASDFWKASEAGVKKAQSELPNYNLEFKYPEQSSAAIQTRLMDDLVAAGVSGIMVSAVDPK